MITYKNSPIAVIDSGIGGLSLLKSLHKKYPNENYIYLADNLYMPYGNKSARFIKNRLLELVNYLHETFNVKLIIIGCNTASIIALPYLRKHSSVEVNGLDLRELNTLQEDFIVLCTKLSSNGYKEFVTHNCRNLAKYIEDNYFDKRALKRKIKSTMSKIVQNNVILACSHYELIVEEFKKVCNKNFVLPCEQFVKNFKLSTHNLGNKVGDVLMLATLPTKAYIDKLWRIFNN